MASTSTRGGKRRQYLQSSDGYPASVAPPRRRKGKWLLLSVLIGLPLLVFAAPIVIAKTPLLGAVVALGAKEVNGKLTVGSASLNWVQPVELRDVELKDAQGNTVAKIEEITSGRTLFGLLTNLSDLGSFQVVKPEIDLMFENKTSNLEEALAPMLEPKPKAVVKKESVGVGLKVIDGVVRIADTVGGRTWQIDELNCDIALPADTAKELSIAAAGRVTPADPAGHFSVQITVQPGDASTAPDPKDPAAPWLASSGKMNISAHVLPLELLEPLLQRFAGGGEVSGLADIEYSGEWGRDPSGARRGQLAGQATASNLVMVGPWLGDDRLRLAQIHVPCNFVLDGSRLEIRNCDLKSDVANLQCGVAIENIDQLNAAALASVWSVLPHTRGEVRGTVDVARLAQLLPGTMRIREGMQIDEGTINVSLTSGAQNGQWSCAGEVDATKLVASEAGRQIIWEHPLIVSFIGHNTAQGPVIERLQGESDFLKFAGTGTPEAFNLTANFELARLGDELGKFIDLGELRLAGEGTSYIQWKRNPDDTFATAAELQATNLALARPGRPAWNDAKLTVNVESSGKFDGAKIARVDVAKLQVVAAEDVLFASLTSPVTQINDKTVWPVETRLQGELLRWVGRIEPWFALPADWDIRGRADIISTVNCSANVCELAKYQADFQSLHVWGPGLYLDEPRLRVTAVGKLSVPDSRLDITDVTLTANDVAARVTDASFVVSGKPDAQQRVNSAIVQCNLGTLHRWTQNPREEANVRMNGSVTAKLSANIANSAPALDLDVTVDNLEAVPSSGQPWREKQLRLVASGKYDETTDTMQLARCELTSEAAQLKATGRVDRWSKDRQLQLSGQSSYDLEKVSVLLKPYLGNDVQLTGRETHSFSLSGPIGAAAAGNPPVKPVALAAAQPSELPPAGVGGVAGRPREPMSFDFLKELTGKADAGWQSANVFGFAVGGAKLNATLANGVFDLQPTAINVSGGRLNLAARAVLSPGPACLYLPNGVLIQEAAVSEAMCHEWLMFAHPVFADATETTGKFSVTLNGSKIPLDDPKKADVDGRITIHSVEIGPNPLVRELQVLLGRAATAKMSKESNIDFRLYNERVYHKNLELQFPELTVRTSGSVGLDETLQLTAEFPIPPKWLRNGNGLLGDALKSMVIRVPIAGTLHKPKLDEQAIDQAFKDVLKKTADGLLQDGIGRQLDRLDRLIPGLQPKQP